MKYGFIQSKLDGTEKQLQLNEKLKLPEQFVYKLPKVLDQGYKPICVPCSISSYINWKLNINSEIEDHKVDLEKVFDKYGTREGMTFKDALHYLKHEGMNTDEGLFKINQYAMVGSIPILKQAILINGPCIGGLPVKDSSSEDFWNGNKLEGGHAIAIVGYDKEGFIIRNSWGTMYGDRGYSRIPYSDFNKFYEIWSLINL